MTTRLLVISLTALSALLPTVYGETCAITNPAQPFSVLTVSHPTNAVALTWGPTCTNYAFGVFSTDQPLSTNSQWQSRAGMWGNLSGTSQWTDIGVTNRARFYKILRIQPSSTSDWDGDGLPDEYELQYGLNPFSSSDATNDPDGDGYSNWDEFLMGSNPTNANDPITVYVDSANTNGVWDGSQANPFRSIQDAIESSVDLSSNLAIRVRPGKYYEPVSNLQYDPYSGALVSTRQFLFIYAANQDWSLSTDPESHIVDSLGFQHRDLLLFTGAPSAPAVEFSGVARARINGFTLRGGQGPYGAGIFASSTNNGPIDISNCIIERNGGINSEAGGIYIQAATNSMIYNTAVARNVGEIGGIYDVNGVRIWNCTIVSNTTLETTFGAVTGGSGAPNIRNCIIWSNGTGAVDLYFANADYSTFGSNEFVTSGTHNLSIDPILVNLLFGNYRLQTNSPVRGAGTSLPIEQRDLYGNPRPLTGRFDIGANQYTDSLGSGMQDDWEIKHSLSLSVNQGALDFDGDGLSNLQEYNLNTDPNNPDTDGDGISDGPLAPSGSGLQLGPDPGLQPGPDPDPTTPDLVLDTIFWDYYYESVFLLYVDGVPDPRWINYPATAPRPVVLNNYHIGSHVNLQWQFLSSSGFDPAFLVFYVPHTTVGNIIPDLNAVPLDQIQFGFGDMAPPDGPWGFTLAQTTPTSTNGVCPGGGGFDDESPQFPVYGQTIPALSVPQSSTNTVTVIINPTNVVGQILFQTTNSTTATASPSTAASVTQLVSVAGLATGNAITSDQLVVLGYGAQNTFTTTCSRVAIDILPKRTNVTVAIWAITATGEPGTTPTKAPTQASLSTYLNQVFGTQANVFMNILPLVSINVNYDLNTNTVLDVATNREDQVSAEQAAITNAAFRSGAINIYYVHSISATNYALALSYPPLRLAFVGDLHEDSTENVTAHELGHHLGIPYAVGAVGEYGPGVPTMPGLPDRLMGPDSGSNPCRLIRSEWETNNNSAATFH